MRCVPRQSLGTSNPLLSVLASAGVMIKASPSSLVSLGSDLVICFYQQWKRCQERFWKREKEGRSSASLLELRIWSDAKSEHSLRDSAMTVKEKRAAETGRRQSRQSGEASGRIEAARSVSPARCNQICSGVGLGETTVGLETLAGRVVATLLGGTCESPRHESLPSLPSGPDVGLRSRSNQQLIS